jgi:probable O-glycosylation ligase (exosortase A-associated)
VVAFGALMAFIIVSLTAPQSFVPALAPFRLALLTGASAVVALFVDAFLHQRPLLGRSRETWVAACLAIWATVSVIFSYWPGGSVMLLPDFLKTLVAFWLLGTLVDTPARLRSVAWMLSVLAVPLAMTGIKNFFSGAFLTESGHLPVQRIRGYDAPLTDNPNDLALMLNLILPLTIALLLIERRPRARVVLTGMALISVAAILLTSSRAGFLTLVITGLLYGRRLFTGARRGWVVAAVVLALVAASWLPSSYVNRLGTITNIEADTTGSAQERWRDTLAATSFALAHPMLGAGFGMNAIALNETRGAFWKAVHNVYLQVAVELGLPGLILFLLFVVGTFKSVRAVLRGTAGDPASSDVFRLADGLYISLIAFAVEALFHPVAYQLYFYYMAGLVVAAKAIYEARPDARKELVGSVAHGGPGAPRPKHGSRRPGLSRPR